MTIEHAELLSVCRLCDPGGVISVYVDAEPGDTAGSAPTWVEDVRVDLRRLCSDARLRELEPAIARLLDPAGTSRGRVLFCGATGGEPHEFRIPMQLETRVTLADAARLQPLLAALEAGRAAGIVLATMADVRLLEVVNGRAEELLRDVVAPPKFEWSEMKEPAGAHEEDMRRIIRRLAPQVSTAVADRGWDRVVIAGNPRLARPLADALHVRGEVTVIQIDRDVSPREHPARIAERFRADLELATHRRAEGLLARAQDAALAGGSGAIGVDDVLSAVTEGRAAWVALDADATLRTSADGHAGPTGDASDTTVMSDVTARLIGSALEAGVPFAVLSGQTYPGLQAAGTIALLRW